MADANLRGTLRLLGIATRAELLASGMSQTQIATGVDRGTLIRLDRGTYARTELAGPYMSLDGGDRLLRAAAALAAVGPTAAVSHQSAAQLYGIDLLDKPGDAVCLTCPPARGRHAKKGVHLYSADLPADHVSTAHGLPMTTPARTVVDIARTLEFRAGVVAADSALHRKLTTSAELQAVIEELPRRRGIIRAREVVDVADGRAESPLESIARVVFHDCGLPPPELQVWLGGDSEPVGRVDFYWRAYRTVAEVDGGMKYQDPQRAKAQLKRDALLRADGYEVVHFDWQEITQAPHYVGAQVRRAFARGARISGPPSRPTQS